MPRPGVVPIVLGVAAAFGAGYVTASSQGAEIGPPQWTKP
jgi:hypothetical protein